MDVPYRFFLFPSCSLAGLAAALLLLASIALGIEKPENVAKDLAVTEHLDQALDLNLPFQDATRGPVTLRDLIISGRPALIVPVYYGCPRLCGLVLAGMARLVDELDLKLGTDYSVITYSFDEMDDRASATARMDEYLAKLKDGSGAKDHWHFLTAESATIATVSDQLGFRFMDEGGKQFSHSAVMMVLTPDGRISRYFYGVSHDPRNARFALVEASRGRIGSAFDRAFLYCFKYDNTQGRYTLVVWRTIQLVGMGSALAVFLLILTLYLREKRIRS